MTLAAPFFNVWKVLQPGVVSERSIQEARRAVEADVIAVARAERTLRIVAHDRRRNPQHYKELDPSSSRRNKARCSAPPLPIFPWIANGRD